VRSRLKTALLTLVLAGSAAMAAAERATPALSLVVEEGRLFLAGKGARRLILHEQQSIPSTWGERVLTFPNGTRAFLPLLHQDRIAFRRRGRAPGELSLAAILKAWLERDAPWGGAKRAEELRLMHRRDRGVTGLITNAVPSGAGFLAVLSWRCLGPSGEPIVAQHLVRLTASPEPKLQALRRRDVPAGWEYGLSSTPVPRLFRSGGRLLLYEKPASPEFYSGTRSGPPSELVEITANGARVKRVAALPPARYPVGLLDGRWLVLAEPNQEARQQLWGATISA
jgi:hypothetical protein